MAEHPTEVRTRSTADIETAYGLSVIAVENGGTHLKVQVDDQNCRRATMTGIAETADNVTLHMRVPRSTPGAACDLAAGGTVHDVELCAPVWGRRVELSVGRPPARSEGCD